MEYNRLVPNKSRIVECLKREASGEQAIAMEELESRGFKFLVHFGTKNAVERLEAMNLAMAEGKLYEHLRDGLGVVTE